MKQQWSNVLYVKIGFMKMLATIIVIYIVLYIVLYSVLYIGLYIVLPYMIV